MATSNIESDIPKDKSEKKKTLKKFVSYNRIIIICIIVIVSVFIWAKVKINNIEKIYIAENERLILDNINTIDSLNETHIKQLTVILSWAVRRHVLHDNLEEINLMFLSFIKENNVAKIQLISTANSKVLVSTDKNEEGESMYYQHILKTSKVTIYKPLNSPIKIVVAPIMGLNQKEGILIVHYNFKNS
jgi:hypothetical protein